MLTFVSVKGWKTVKILGVTLIILALLTLIVLAIGDRLLNRYLNDEGKDTINKILPINGKISYDRVSIHPFRDFPNISLKLRDLEINDSLISEHGQTPITVKNLFLNASLGKLRKKQLEIKSIELDGLSVNILDREDGYSNFSSLIQPQAKDSSSFDIMDGWTVETNYTDLLIKDLQLHKIDEITGQKAHLFANKLRLNTEAIDSAFQLNFNIEALKLSPVPDQSWAELPVELGEVKAEVHLDKSFSRATLVNIELSNGNIDLHKDSLGISNLSDLIGSKERISTNDKDSKRTSFELDGADIHLHNIDLVLVNQQRNRHLEGRIADLSTQLNLATDTSAIIDLHLDVDQLALNTQKGAFLTNSKVRGKVMTSFANDLLKISSPDLSINEDTFNIVSHVSTDERSVTTLTIEKSEAYTEKIRPLLTEYLRSRISTYDVYGPLYAKLLIVFTPGVRKARANLDLKVENQEVYVKGTLIKNAKVDATFINGLYDDGRQYTEHKKNSRFLIHRGTGEANGFQMDTENALITYTPEDGVRMIADATVTGEAATASKFLEHDRFTFQEGAFTLATETDASLKNLESFITGTDFQLMMRDMVVYYPAGNTSLPLSILEMRKERELTTFGIEGLAVGTGSPIFIQGEVENLSSVFFPEKEEQLQTQAKIRASSIRWGGLVALFGQDGIITAARKDREKLAKRSMKQTLTGIQESFRPIVEVIIDTVHYGKEFQLIDFKTGLNFKEDRTLVLEKTSFDIEDSKVTLDGEVVINQLDFTKFDFDIALQHLDFDVLLPKFNYFGVHLIEQIHDQPDDLTMHIKLSGELDDIAGLNPETIDAYVTYESFAENKFSGSLALKANPSTKKIDAVFAHSGLPVNINNLLGSKEYIFDKGWFTVSFEFDDNFESIAQMVEESKVGLTIADAEVHIAELGVTIPLSRIEVSSIDNNAYYHMLIRSDSLDQELVLDGVVKNIRHFAFNDTKAPYEIDLSITSPRLVWDHLKETLVFDDMGSDQSSRVIKESIAKILRDFNPNVKLDIEKFVYTDRLSFNDIYAHAYMEDDILQIDSAYVEYGNNSRIEAYLDVDMSHKSKLPFDLNLGLTYIDISHTLKYFDYFSQDVLRSAKKIDGKVWLDLDMSGEIDLLQSGYDYSKTDADLRFVVQDLVVIDLETINDVTKRIGRKKRFEELRFAPIHSEIKVDGKSIKIGETEIQSNAIHAFVEGTIDRSSPEDLWISIPLENLKKPDLDVIPEKTGYAAPGSKFFLQWITSENKEDGKAKLRFSKRRFFQERRRGKEYRAYRKAMRKERRRLREGRL